MPPIDSRNLVKCLEEDSLLGRAMIDPLHCPHPVRKGEADLGLLVLQMISDLLLTTGKMSVHLPEEISVGVIETPLLTYMERRGATSGPCPGGTPGLTMNHHTLLILILEVEVVVKRGIWLLAPAAPYLKK